MVTSPAHQEFLNGAKDTLPLIVGAIPFGLIFGALAVASGLTTAATLALSAFVFAGSAQFIAVGLIAAGTSWPLIVLTTFVVNLRHLLYSATLAPYVSKLSQRWQIPMAFLLTDETFAIAIARYTQQPNSTLNRWYYLGSALFMYLNWQLCTYLGLTLGQLLPDAAGWGLDFAMPVTFIGLVIPYLKNRAMLITTTVAGVVALLVQSWPHQSGLMVAAIVGIFAGISVETWQQREGKHG